MNLKFFVLCLFLLSLVSLKAQNSFYFEFEDRITFGENIQNRPKISLFSEHLKENKKVGSFFFGQTTNKWGEGYAGVFFKPANWIGLYGGVGMETDSIPYRLALGNNMQYKKISVSQWYEYGGTGFWYSFAINYKISTHFKIGLLSKRYYGTGISLFYYIRNTPISISNSFLYDFEFKKYRDFVTLRFSY